MGKPKPEFYSTRGEIEAAGRTHDASPNFDRMCCGEIFDRAAMRWSVERSTHLAHYRALLRVGVASPASRRLCDTCGG
eukprot:scaffold121369_cov62-Phaeocystis_antarctica.AAC.4